MSPLEANKIIAEYMGFHKIVLVDDETPDCLYCEICGPEVNVLEHDFLEPHPCNIQTKMPEYYTESLDKLIPVWEKISEGSTYSYGINLFDLDEEFVSSNFITISREDEFEVLETSSKMQTSITEAAAIATAKAIEEL